MRSGRRVGITFSVLLLPPRHPVHTAEDGRSRPLGKPFWGRDIATAAVKVLTARIQERGGRARFPFSRTRFRLTVGVRHESGYDGVRTRWGTQGLGDE